MKGWIKSCMNLCGLDGNKPDLTRLPTNKLYASMLNAEHIGDKNGF
jgi:hypothetical protein